MKAPVFFTKVSSRTIYLYAIVIGILSGLASLAIFHAVKFLLEFCYSTLAGVQLSRFSELSAEGPDFPAVATLLLFCLIPAFGGLVSGWISFHLAPEARGAGTELFLESFHHRAGTLRRRTGLVKFICSSITLGTGGSGGKEGPMMLIGASLGSLFARLTRLGHRARRTLFLAGAAGGLGAIFRTPLGGAITAVEVLYKEDFEADALIPCIISSVTAYTIFGAFAGYGHVLHFRDEIFHSPLELIFYVFLALVCTGFAYLFVRFYRGVGHLFAHKIPVDKKYQPALGGLLLGLVALFKPEILGSGLELIQHALDGEFPSDWVLASWSFLLLALLKMLATSLTVQSGGSAGVMIPAFFMGAMMGGAVGSFCHHFFPAIVPSVGPFIVVGMAATFSAVTNASLGGLVMVTEITGGYELLPPLMIVSVVSLIVSSRWSIYQNQVLNKFFSQAHHWDMERQGYVSRSSPSSSELLTHPAPS